MARSRSLVLLLAIVVSAVPSGSRARGVPALGSPWRAAQQKRAPAPAAFLHGLSSRVTLDQLRQLRADYLTAPASQGGAGLVALAPTDLSAIPSGDLTGDGRDDVLTIETTYSTPERTLLRARRGTTGAELWSVNLPPGFLGVADVNGDKISDVILVSFVDTVVGADALVAGAALVDTDQIVRVLNGRNGSQLWGREIFGHIAIAVADGYPAGAAVVFAAHNLVASLMPAGDADGDGVNDIFTGIADWGYLDALSVLGEIAGSTGRFTSAYVSGRTGAQIGKGSSLAGIGMVPFTVPIEDLSGDGHPDMVSVRANAEAYELLAHSTDGDALWTAPLTTIGVPMGFEATGDGRTDVLLEEFDFDTFSDTISLHDGVDGTRRWTRPLGEFGFSMRAGTVDPGSGQDLVLVSFPSYETATLETVSGATGEPIRGPLDIVAAAPEGHYGLAAVCYCADDLTGDGVQDVLVARLDYDEDFLLVAQSVSAISGGDYTTSWSQPLTLAEDLPLPVGGDVNGDGRGDTGNNRSMPPGSLRVTFRSGSTNETLFSRDIPVTDSTGWFADRPFAANLVADAKDEIVLGLFDGARSRVYGFGPTGLLWSI